MSLRSSPLHEWPQLPRKYQVGEEYARHHDMHNVTDNEFTPGPRIYTFFLYLSDVDEGGETLLDCLDRQFRDR